MATLTEIQIRSGESRAFARWRLLDGSILETALTAQEYSDLGLKGAGEPPRRGVPAGATWLCAALTQAFDTPDRKLPFGGYWRVNEDIVYVGVDRLDPISLRLITKRIEDLIQVRQNLSIDGATYRLRDGTIERL